MFNKLFITIFAAVLCAPEVFAQSGMGSVQGTVRDPAGAVIPQATIRVLQVETGIQREAQSNTAGLFTFPSLPIGGYQISVSANGFQSWEAKVQLQVGQVATVNAGMQLATTASEVTVVGDVTTLLVESSPTLGQIIERQRIEQLPLNGRFLNGLLGQTIPGVEGSKTFGLNEAATEYVQDGAALVNRDTGNLQARPPGLDTIQEFKVETNNSSAKINRPATVIVSTKAGTNELHGALFETARNNGLAFARRRQDFYEKPPHYVRNEFGFSVGGPVVLPKIYNGQNRTFFFAAWEAYRKYESRTTSLSMPTGAMRNGDFSGLVDSLGRPSILYDPWTTQSRAMNWSRLPYPNNQIPASKRSPLATYLYSVTPLPTHNDRNPMVTSNFFAPIQDNREDSTITVRLDHRFSERDNFFLRVTHGDNTNQYPGNEPSYPTLDGSTNITNRTARNASAVASWTHTFSPAFFGETLVNWSYENYDIYSGDYYQNWATKLGLPNPLNEDGFPYIYETGFGMYYVQPDNRRNNRTWIAGLDQNFTKMAGKHEFHFGVRLRNERMNVLPDQGGVSGRHYFNSCATCLYDPASGTTYGSVPRTGHNSANLYLGLANYYQVVYSQKMYRFRDREISMYLQDNWKVSPRLTLNLGLRYEYHPPLWEAQNLFTGFDMNSKAIVNGRPIDELIQLGRTTPGIVNTFTNIGVKFISADQAGLPANLTYADKTAFGPRVGLAYKLSGAKRPVILRTGYSLFVYPPPLRNFDAATRSNPPFQATFTRHFTAANQSPDGLPNYAMRSVPTIVAGLNSANAIDLNNPAGVTRGSFTTNYFDPNQPVTRVGEWNFTIEREIMDSTVVRAAYVGNHGFNLEQFQSFNNQSNSYIWFMSTGQPLPTGEYSGVARRSFDQTTYGEIRRFQKTGSSNFNGATIEVQRRQSGGWGYQFFYTLSNTFRSGGNGWRDGIIPDPIVFMPNTMPTDMEELDRLVNYQRDTTVPQHRLRWNWLVDLPFGRGKKFGGNVSSLIDKLIGGWQLAGTGTYRSNYWALPTGNWGYLGDIEIYGTEYKIEDCRSGTCIPGYLHWNGYIPANRINSVDANGKPNGVMGVPSNYKPAHLPIFPTPKEGVAPNDPNAQWYESNNVWIPMKNGTTQRVGMDTNFHNWRNQNLPGPWNFGLDASLFKTVRVTERVSLRMNADFFNVLNNPGIGQPNSTNGIISLQNSSNGPRQLQLTLRLTW